MLNGAIMRKRISHFNISKTILSFFLLVIVLTAGCKKDDFKGEIKGECPVVTTDPADKAVEVVLNKVITATFNTNMAASTVNSKTFIIKQGSTVITGIVAPTADGKYLLLRQLSRFFPL